MTPGDFEKFGAFYLGRPYDLAERKARPEPLLYDSKDLVTHALCVGMTGSGKTGLCLALLEEAAIDGIPAIIIDPKGDMANLALTFPELRPQDFLPWINPDDAARKSLSPGDFAAQQSGLWKKGLAGWGQDGERIRKFRDAVDLTIFTPGSNAGTPVSLLKSFAAPSAEAAGDAESLRDRVGSLVSSLLSLLGIEADPMRSREHIFLSTLIQSSWSQGQDLDLTALIQQIQSPSFTRVGVLDLETFYPAKDRFDLVMALNNLLASPSFASWMEGEPLEIPSLLHTSSGKPRFSIFSIAHLSESERMFFVSMLLNQMAGWMRGQSGTTSLRAIVYMDEIFGYFPPVANPPSKKPLLTLLKQGRAFGIGVVLATQNPVDLDYRGLANIGTWWIGRLQTERDKARVLEGLEGAATSGGGFFDRQAMEQKIAGLGNRIFLMNNVHEDAPIAFESRWALSYLRGPITRDQIKLLRQNTPQATAPVSQSSFSPPSSSSSSRPFLPPDIPQYFVPARGTASSGKLAYQPVVLGSAEIRYSQAKYKVNLSQVLVSAIPFADGPIPLDLENAFELEIDPKDLSKIPGGSASFSACPPEASSLKNYAAWKKAWTDSLFSRQSLVLWRSPSLGLISLQDETEADFRARLQLAAREKRDAAIEALRKKHAPKATALQDRIRRAEAAVQREKEQASQAKMQTAISFGTTLLGAFLGRKVVSAGSLGRAATTARGVGKSMKESRDVGLAEESVEVLQQRLAELEEDFKTEADSLSAYDAAEVLEKIEVRPAKAGITVQLFTLAWLPYCEEKPAWI